jgi:hypothetical protein
VTGLLELADRFANREPPSKPPWWKRIGPKDVERWLIPAAAIAQQLALVLEQLLVRPPKPTPPGDV